MGKLTLSAHIEHWPIAGEFRISRGRKREAAVVVLELDDGRYRGRGECTPYARYGTTPDSVVAELESLASQLRADMGPADLVRLTPAGPTRNALDCAFWDLRAKQSDRRVHELLTPPLSLPKPVETAYTLSLGTPEDMAVRAASVPAYPLLKLKLGGAGDAARMAAVRAARPDARLIGDANEAWTPDSLERLLEAAAAAGIELIEQPLPAGADAALAGVAKPVPVCADESAHVAADVTGLRYRDAIRCCGRTGQEEGRATGRSRQGTSQLPLIGPKALRTRHDRGNW